ncbi:MAG TPA: cytochrome c oxidase subunit 3 [Candidatus Kryptonia bacterium]
MSQLSESIHPAVAHEAHHKDIEGAKMGMWLFLLTELLLFAGLFLVYSVYRYLHSADFHKAGLETHTLLGTLNTMVLLTSSLTMVLSIAAIQRGKKWLSAGFLSSTILLGFVFLIVKYFEWTSEIAKGIYPASPVLLSRSNGEILFFGLYYTMTGLHGLHVIAGMIVLSFMLVFLLRNKITSNDFIKLENAGLYWHLVDIIWIFLFPLFYLIN